MDIMDMLENDEKVVAWAFPIAITLIGMEHNLLAMAKEKVGVDDDDILMETFDLSS